MSILGQVFKSPESDTSYEVRGDVQAVFMQQLGELEEAVYIVENAVLAQAEDEKTQSPFEQPLAQPRSVETPQEVIEQPQQASSPEITNTIPTSSVADLKDKSIGELQAHIDLLYENLGSDPVARAKRYLN